MPLFSAQESLYFVFSGTGDRYYLDSMLKLGEKEKLWMELRDSQYQNIYFVSGAGDACSIRVLDVNSRAAYNKAARWGPITRRPMIPDDGYEARMDAGKLRKWLVELLCRPESGPGAVVLPMETLSGLFSDPYDRGQLDSLIRREHGASSLLLLLPMRIREQRQQMLTDRNGVFAYRSPEGKFLCQELGELILSDEPLPICDRLRQRIGGRFVELDAVTYSGLQSMLRCVCFQRGELWSDEELCRYTNILFNWWYLPEVDQAADLPPNFVKFWNGLFFEQRRREDIYRALYEALLSPSGWKAFQDRAERLETQVNPDTAKSFLFGLERPAAEAKCHVVLEQALLAEIARIAWPGEVYQQFAKTHPGILASTRSAWRQMQAALLTPFNRPIPAGRMRCMEAYYGCYRRASDAQDYDTVCRAVNALLFAGTHLYTENNDTMDCGKRLADYEKYLGLSQDYFTLKQQPTAPATVFTRGMEAARQEKKNTCKKLLDLYDGYLRADPQTSVDKGGMEEAAKTLEQLVQAGISCTDDAAMTSEEADAWLRQRANRR